MRASFKIRLHRRRARAKRKQRKMAFRFAIHEVGHYVVKTILCPNKRLQLKLNTNHGKLIGTVEDTVDPNEIDSPAVMIRVAIAGAIFETYRVNEIDRAFSLLMTTRALREDRNKFDFAKRKLKRLSSEAHSYAKKNYDACFEHLQEEILRQLNEFGWGKATTLAWKLVKERKITISRDIATNSLDTP